MKFYQIALTDEEDKFLKVRFQVKTDGETQRKLQRIAKDLINRQFISSVDKEFEEKIDAPKEQRETHWDILELERRQGN